MIISGLFFIFAFTIVLLLLKLWIGHRSKNLLPHLKKRHNQGGQFITVGFFHPYCNAGGGGERVLWTAIKALQKTHSHVQCVVYTGDVDAKPEEILNKARQRFNIILPKPIEFIYLQRRSWVEACKYPYFTLLGQSFGSVFLGWEALMLFVPDIYIDSMGYAFTIPLFRYFGGCKVGCYVHYPTISTDMLQMVAQRTRSYNNDSFISRSPVLSFVKLLYYKIFAYMYGVAGKRCDIIMVNSTWTFNHIRSLWQALDRTSIVYPPCDVSEFVKIPLERHVPSVTRNILSIAQFRPEKDHSLQIKAFQAFLQRLPDSERKLYRLVLGGSCRNEGDTERVESLKTQCKDLGMADQVDFQLNITFDELKNLMASSVVGLHSMWNEHFGIGVVELMAAGTVTLAHNSGGPKMDIVIPFNEEPTGFLAEDVKSYADSLDDIFKMTTEARLKIRMNARESVARFSDSEFEQSFLAVFNPLLKMISKGDN